MPPSSPQRVLVITPAWNESETIGQIVSKIRSYGYDVLVVDDGSMDLTAAVAASAGAQVLKLPYNLGVGGAMRAGFKHASQHHYDAVIQVDADGQHDPADIRTVLQGLKKADISIGARFANKGDYQVAGPRRWAMVILAKVASTLAHTKLTDVTSGFRAANKKALAQYLDHYPIEYLGDTIDSLIVAIRSGCTVTQVPVTMQKRQGGIPSQNALKSTLYLFRSAFTIFIALTRRKSKNINQRGPS